jgi:hypothetical protein
MILASTTGWGDCRELDPKWFYVKKQKTQLLHVCRHKFWADALDFKMYHVTNEDSAEKWADWEEASKHIGWVDISEDKCNKCNEPIPRGILAFVRVLDYREKID